MKTETGTSSGRDPYRILLVEDDEDDVLMIRELLHEGHGLDQELTAVRSLDEARDLFESRAFDLVLADYRLGGETGLDLVGELSAQRPELPVVLLTGQGSRDIDLRAMETGAADYLSKAELTPPLLERTVRYTVQRNREEMALRRRDEILEAVGAMGRQLLHRPDWPEEMDEILSGLGGATDASRVVVRANRELEDGGLIMERRFEWSRPEFRVDHDDPWPPEISYREAGLEQWKEILGSGGAVWGQVRDLPEAERRLLVSRAIRSMVVVPIFRGREWWGFLKFDVCDRDRAWSSTEVETLRLAADTLGAALQRELHQRTLAEREEQLLASQRMEAMGRLAGGVAHDFNNLLTAVSGYAELLLTELEDEEHRRDCREILDAAERAERLTQQLLAFSSRQVVEPRAVELNARVREMTGMLRRLIGGGIAMTLDLADDPPPVLVDPGQLEQVLVNLVVNARDAMPGGGELEIATVSRRISEGHPDLGSGAHVELRVRDSGEGMDEETRERIFEPFFTTKDDDGGTGLGLATVYGIVTQHDGIITVDSAPGAGTTFRVILPAAEPATQENAPPEGDRTAVEPRGEAVLVVEDQPEVRKLVERILGSQGYRVLSTGDSGEAQRIMVAEEPRIELLITDLVLPGDNGFDLAGKLREDRPDLPVLYISGHTDDHVTVAKLERDRVDFLPKPFTARELLDQVSRMIGRGA